MATHSSVLAWRIPGTGGPGGLPSMGSHRVGHDWRDLAAAAARTSLVVHWLSLQASTAVGTGLIPDQGNGNPFQYLAWKIPWTEEPGRLRSMGSQRVGHDWATSLLFRELRSHTLRAYMLIRFSHVQLFATTWTGAHQALLSMRFSRQEYWSRLSCPPPGDLPVLGIVPTSPACPALQADSLPIELPGKPHMLCLRARKKKKGLKKQSIQAILIYYLSFFPIYWLLLLSNMVVVVVV